MGLSTCRQGTEPARPPLLLEGTSVSCLPMAGHAKAHSLHTDDLCHISCLAIEAATMLSPPLNACTSTSCWSPCRCNLHAHPNFHPLIAVIGACLQPQLAALAHLAAAFAEWQEDCAQAAHSHQEALAGLGLMPMEAFQDMLQPVQVALLLECRLRVRLQQPVNKVGLPGLLACCEVAAGLAAAALALPVQVPCH